jgi:nucleotide-binding universal stress UspA family protein
MLKRLLIPLDGSPLAECTIPFGLSLQGAFSSSVLLHRVLEPGPHATDGQLESVEWRLSREEARAYLERIARSFRSAQAAARVETEVTTGSAPQEIVRLSRQRNIDLVLLSTHGEGGLTRFGLSGTAHKVALAAETSVLLVRAGLPSETGKPARLPRIMVPVDGSTRGDWAAHLASSLAQPMGSELCLVHVIALPEVLSQGEGEVEERRVIDRLVELGRQEAERHLDVLEDLMAHSDVRVHKRVVVASNVPKTLDELAERERASMLVISAHGHSVETGWQYGSVAGSLIEHGRLPILILQDAPRRIQMPGNAHSFSTAALRASYAWSP